MGVSFTLEQANLIAYLMSGTKVEAPRVSRQQMADFFKGLGGLYNTASGAKAFDGGGILFGMFGGPINSEGRAYGKVNFSDSRWLEWLRREAEVRSRHLEALQAGPILSASIVGGYLDWLEPLF